MQPETCTFVCELCPEVRGDIFGNISLCLMMLSGVLKPYRHVATSNYPFGGLAVYTQRDRRGQTTDAERLTTFRRIGAFYYKLISVWHVPAASLH